MLYSDVDDAGNYEKEEEGNAIDELVDTDVNELTRLLHSCRRQASTIRNSGIERMDSNGLWKRPIRPIIALRQRPINCRHCRSEFQREYSLNQVKSIELIGV